MKHICYPGCEWWRVERADFSLPKRENTHPHLKHLTNLVFEHFPPLHEIRLKWGLLSNTEGWVHRLTRRILICQNMLCDDKCSLYKMLALINLGKRESVYSSPAGTEWWFVGSLHERSESGSLTGKHWGCLCEGRIPWATSFLGWFPFGLVVGVASRSQLVQADRLKPG